MYSIDVEYIPKYPFRFYEINQVLRFIVFELNIFSDFFWGVKYI